VWSILQSSADPPPALCWQSTFGRERQRRQRYRTIDLRYCWYFWAIKRFEDACLRSVDPTNPLKPIRAFFIFYLLWVVTCLTYDNKPSWQAYFFSGSIGSHWDKIFKYNPLGMACVISRVSPSANLTSFPTLYSSENFGVFEQRNQPIFDDSMNPIAIRQIKAIMKFLERGGPHRQSMEYIFAVHDLILKLKSLLPIAFVSNLAAPALSI